MTSQIMNLSGHACAPYSADAPMLCDHRKTPEMREHIKTLEKRIKQLEERDNLPRIRKVSKQVDE